MLNLNRIIEEKNCLLQNAVSKLKLVQQDKQKKEKENIELYQKILTIREEVQVLMGTKRKPRKPSKEEKLTSDKNQPTIRLTSDSKSKGTKDRERYLIEKKKENDEKPILSVSDVEMKYECTESSMVNNVEVEEQTEININLDDDKKSESEVRSYNTCSNIDKKLLEKENNKFFEDDEEEENSQRSNITEIQ